MIQIEIKKPLYDSFCNIDARLVEKAIHTGQMLEIKIPQGTRVWHPAEWKRTGKEIKQVFKYPDNPMRMIGNYVFGKEIENSKQDVLL